MTIKCNLIVDLNYILMRAVFTLQKSNMLYGNLNRALEASINSYRKWYPFSKIYLVSDSKEKSWRKGLYEKYKAHRKRDTDIDWDFVYTAYAEFKASFTSKNIKILESGGIEGDDWISFVLQTTNKEGYSNIVISNDYDIKQLLKFDINDGIINIMTNEIFNKTKLFMPKNFNVFINRLKKVNNDDIFCLNNNAQFLTLLTNFVERCEVIEIDPIQSLLVKMICGDESDNIESVWVTYGANGRKRGIGSVGAESIVEKYVNEFGEPNLDDPELIANIADLVMEKRKVNSIYTDDIIKNISLNKQLVNLELSNIPTEIVEKMIKVYNS